jgi:protein ImuA
MIEELLKEGKIWRGGEPPPSVLGKGEVVKFDIPEIDEALGGGLTLGAIHEFALERGSATESSKHWYPPLLLLSSILSSALRRRQDSTESNTTEANIVVWIGRRCFPTPYLLQEVSLSQAKHWSWRSRCIFLTPGTKDQRLWSATQALRSPLIKALIVDGSRFDFAATRRLQLAASNSTALTLLVRPAAELYSKTSAAHTRWKISPALASHRSPCWKLELLRARGAETPKDWTVRLNAKNALKIESQTTSQRLVPQLEIVERRKRG